MYIPISLQPVKLHYYQSWVKYLYWVSVNSSYSALSPAITLLGGLLFFFSAAFFFFGNKNLLMPVDFIIQEFNSAVTLKGHSFRLLGRSAFASFAKCDVKAYIFFPLSIHLEIGNAERGGSRVEQSTHLYGHLNEQRWKGSQVISFLLNVSTLDALSEGHRYGKRHNIFRQGADSSFLIIQLKKIKEKSDES